MSKVTDKWSVRHQLAQEMHRLRIPNIISNIEKKKSLSIILIGSALSLWSLKVDKKCYTCFRISCLYKVVHPCKWYLWLIWMIFHSIPPILSNYFPLSLSLSILDPIKNHTATIHGSLKSCLNFNYYMLSNASPCPS